MASNYYFAIVLSAVLLLVLPTLSFGELVQEQPLVLKYHNGQLLKGKLTVNLIWYGTFTPIQRSIIVDFINSLSTTGAALPSASAWWKTTEKYKVGSSALTVGKQFLHPAYTLGKNLKGKDLLALATKFNELSSITVVLTAKDVNVEGFCMSRCGTHGSVRRGSGGARTPYIWGWKR
uniref:Transmembrane protein n=1 Tax=Medicago truncatula TaxID=3880 RepID=B7FIF1_MEDTR|nr:unknown [Medicago truncatula]